ncbi:hypothetical protein ACM55F_17330 [Flavobacterium sp. XS2P12]|uniref:hypothetical protein n=1 Tax=Flavobacterium melibiosi TaxID=3398734 RepID=UPI003A839D7D
MIAQEIPIEQVLLLRQKVLWPNKNLDFVRILKACICLFLDQQWISCISLFMEDNHRAEFRNLPLYQHTKVKDMAVNYSNTVFNIYNSKKLRLFIAVRDLKCRDL